MSKELVQKALATVCVAWNDAIYTLLVTLWIFLSQVLSTDHSCRLAVARLLAHRISPGQSACSPQTRDYCQAKKRLPEQFFADVACRAERVLDSQATRNWLWKGRRGHVFDGTIVSMPARSIRFQGMIQTLAAFQPLIADHNPRSGDDPLCLYEQFLDAIAKHHAGDRPDRFEPRLQKRRHKRYGFGLKRRATLRRELAKLGTSIHVPFVRHTDRL